jgi:hypothetical protein
VLGRFRRVARDLVHPHERALLGLERLGVELDKLLTELAVTRGEDLASELLLLGALRERKLHLVELLDAGDLNSTTRSLQNANGRAGSPDPSRHGPADRESAADHLDTARRWIHILPLQRRPADRAVAPDPPPQWIPATPPSKSEPDLRASTWSPTRERLLE